MKKQQWYIGCSGYNYPSWKNIFYPGQIKPAQWLEYYSTQFKTVELNNTFYRFPVVKNLQRMYSMTPAGFSFSVKAHKVITHSMRMNKTAEKIFEFTDIVENGLRDKLACILFQLPPSFKYSDENIERVILDVPHQSRNVIEFRNVSWWREDVRETLRAAHLSLCDVSFPGLPEEYSATSEKYYLRMHGVPKLFYSSYSSAQLDKMIKKIPTECNERFIYFNNTAEDVAFRNARSVEEKLQDALILK